jgi:hypothetical protein
MTELIGELRRREPQLVALAECVSLAVNVDWAFLRRARLRFLPESTAGLEADLCFSPLVEAAGGRALLLDPEAAGALRSELKERSPELLRAVRAFTSEEHARAPRIVRLCEELLWSELSPTTTVKRHVSRYAGQVLRALAGDGAESTAAADDVGRWTLHYVCRLPDSALRREDVWHLRVASCERLGVEPPPDPDPVPDPDRVRGYASAVTGARRLVHHPVPVGVVARSDGIVLSRPPAGGSKTVHAGGTRHRVRLDVSSSLAHASEPVRLELDGGRTLQLPFTVVQRIGVAGELEMSLAHPGAALDIAVSRHLGTSPDAAHCAVLLADGTVVLHGGDGSETRRLPPEATPTARGRLALSADGTLVSYVQGGRMHHEPLRGGRISRPGEFADERGQLADATGVTGQALFWGRTTATARTADGRTVVQAAADGRVRAVPSGPGDGGVDPVLDVGRAPWQVSSLAVSADGQRVAAVGNDSLLIEWPLVSGADPRETRLRFCATRIFAAPGGSWVVAGSGGPMELSTEDGRRYRVTPDTALPPDDDGVPAWSRGCALVATRGGEIAAASEIPGVDCLAVPVRFYRPGAGGEFESWLAAAHGREARVVADLDVSLSGEAEVLDKSCALLDHGFDGLRLLGAETLDEALLDDVRHLTEGYDERVLLYGPSAHGTPEPSGISPTRPALMLASSLLTVIDGGDSGDAGESGDGAESGDADESGDGGFRLRMSTLKLWIERTFMAPPATTSTYRWGLQLPAPRPREAERLAAAVLLSLPGSPVLPLGLLTGDRSDPDSAPLAAPGSDVAPAPARAPDPTPLGSMLELRRNHLALTRGECRLLDLPAVGVLALLRRHGDESVLCLANLASHAAEAEIDSAVLGEPARLLDLFDGSALGSGRRVVRVPLAPGTVRWFGLPAQ